MILFFSIMLASCDREEHIIDESVFEPTQEITSDRESIKFSELPPYVQSQIMDTEILLKKTTTGNKTEKPFGEIIRTKVNVLKTKEKATSYTLVMERTDQERLYYDNMVLVKDSLGGIQKHILRYEPEEDWFLERMSGKSGYDSFTGKVSVYDENGGMITSTFLKEGKITKDQAKGGMSSKRVCEVIDVIYAGVEIDGVFYADVTIKYSCYETGTGGGGPSDPGGGPIDGGQTVEDVAGPTTVIEVHIFNNLTGKAKCVYDKLDATGKKFRDAIQKFDGEFPVAHLKYSMDYNLPNTTNAVTNNGGTNIIEVKINGNTLPSRTVLGLARTLTHETIHAELYRKVRSVGGNVSINDFPGIYDYYRRYVKNWQHEQMAAHYRQTIVDILKEFDNNQHSNQFYNDLAWEGLQGTTSWNELPGTEQTRIKNVISNFKSTGNKTCN